MRDRELRRDPANGVGAGLDTVTPWTTTLPPRTRVANAGEVEASTVAFRIPWRRRAAVTGAEVVRQTAARFGVNPESKLRWVPVIGLCLTFALAVGSISMAYGLWRGRAETKEETLSDNQKATAALITAAEGRLTKAADELKQSAREMRGELNTKVDAIDGKVESIRGSVGAQQVQLAELRARLEAANEDKTRLWQTIATQDLKIQRLDRNASAAPQPTPR